MAGLAPAGPGGVSAAPIAAVITASGVPGLKPGLVQAALLRVQAVQEGGLAGLVHDPDDLLPGIEVEPGGIGGTGREAVPRQVPAKGGGLAAAGHRVCLLAGRGSGRRAG